MTVTEMLPSSVTQQPTLADLVAPFVASVAAGRVEVYNEFSLQHELGIYLRGVFAADRIQFERNVSHFFSSCTSFTKREIDICIFSPDKTNLRWAIELKYPRNGQYPETMFSFCKDVAFTEELRAAGFARAGLLVFAEDEPFWSGPGDGIYAFFRGRRPLTGPVQKPTGARDSQVTIRGTYPVQWQPMSGRLRFLTIDAQPRYA